MSRYKSVRDNKKGDYEDLSIVSQEFRNFETLLSPPEVEAPVREYSQRSSNSGLPDGSVYNEKYNAPIGETIDKFCFRLSKAAKAAWSLWTKVGELETITKDGTVVSPIQVPLEDLVLTEEEKLRYTRLKRLLFVEEHTSKAQHQEKLTRLISETNQSFRNHDLREPENPDLARYYVKKEITKDEFGAVTVKEIKMDRCGSKNIITTIPGVSLSDVKAVTGNPSYDERLGHIVLSDYNTSVWRKDYSASKKEDYIPNITPADDPDFIPPSSISSRNFNIYPPASRHYNTVYRVYLDEKRYTKWYPKKGQKDYTSLSSIEYMLKEKGKSFHKVDVDETSVGGVFVPNCRFEIDLRVTYGDSLTPDPLQYKKVDPDSTLGMWILQKLDSEPHLFKEFSWEYEAEDGNNNASTKKVAVGFIVDKPSSGPRRVYWVYLDEKKNTVGKPAFIRKKIVHPQILYRDLSYCKFDHIGPVRVSNKLFATIRMTDNYCFFDRRKNELIPFDVVKERYFKVLIDQGYEFIKQAVESHYNNVILFHFIHVSAKTKSQRKKLFQSLEKIGESNGC